MQLFLLRHGETDWNRDHRLQGQTDVPLNAAGREQFARVARRLARERLDAVYSSDLARARDSALPVAEAAGAAVVTDVRLREQRLGAWEGEPWLTLRRREDPQTVRRFLEDREFAPVGGETRTEFLTRIREFFAALPARHPGGRVAVITHGGVVFLWLAEVLGLPPGAPKSFRIANGGLHRLEFVDGRWHVVTLNETHFLADPAAAAVGQW